MDVDPNWAPDGRSIAFLRLPSPREEVGIGPHRDEHLVERGVVEPVHLVVLGRDVARVRAEVGSDEVLLGLSGGVDSAVAAALIHRAIGKDQYCIFVDNGLLRAGEAEEVVDTFGRHMHMKLIHVEAADEFLGTQGDPWDTQWDMFFALIGAVTGLVLLSRVRTSLTLGECY